MSCRGEARGRCIGLEKYINSACFTLHQRTPLRGARWSRNPEIILLCHGIGLAGCFALGIRLCVDGHRAKHPEIILSRHGIRLPGCFAPTQTLVCGDGWAQGNSPTGARCARHPEIILLRHRFCLPGCFAPTQYAHTCV